MYPLHAPAAGGDLTEGAQSSNGLPRPISGKVHVIRR